MEISQGARNYALDPRGLSARDSAQQGTRPILFVGGLWSVSISKDLIPSRKLSEKRSQAQVIAKASFSTWAYLSSVGVMDLEAKTTGRQPPSCF